MPFLRVFPIFFGAPFPRSIKFPTFFMNPNLLASQSHQEGPEAGLQGWNVFNHTVHASGVRLRTSSWVFNGFREWEFSREKTQNGSRSFLGLGQCGHVYVTICFAMFGFVYCISYDMPYKIYVYLCKDKCAEGSFEPAVA